MVKVTSKHLEDGKTIYYTFTDGNEHKTCNITLLISMKDAVDLFFYLTSISTIVSWVSCILIFIVFIKLVKYRSLTIFLLLWLTFVDFLTLSGGIVQIMQFIQQERDKSYSDFVNNYTTTFYNHTNRYIGCDIQAAFTSFAQMWSFSLTIVFAIHLYQIQLNFRGNFVIPTDRRKYILIFSLAIPPVIIVIIGLVQHKFGWAVFFYGRQWCWVIDRENPPEYAVWIVLGGRGFELAAYIMAFTIYILSKYRLRQLKRTQDCKEKTNLLDVTYTTPLHDLPRNYSILLWIFLYLYVTRFTGLLRYIVILINSLVGLNEWWCNYLHVDENFLVFVALFLNNLQSVVNFFIFCIFDHNTRIVALQELKRICSAKDNN